MILLPKFIITDGESQCTDILRVPWQSIVNNVNLEFRTKSVNPYRDFQHGGTTILWRGKNVWISDEKMLGKLLAFIFS